MSLTLPLPGDRYDRAQETRRNRALERADAQSWKRNEDIELVGTRLILRSPDGTRWAVTVSDLGVLSATEIL